MNFTGILLVFTVSAMAHAATVRYDVKGTDSKKSQGQSDFPVTKSSNAETSSRSAQEDIHLAQLKLKSNQIENSRIHNNNKFAYQSEAPTSQAFHSQDHFATDSPSNQDFQRDQSSFHSQQPGVPVTTVSAPQSLQNDQYSDDEFSFQPEAYNDQQTAPNHFYNNDQQQQFFNNERASGEQQFFNKKQQTPDQEQFYGNNKQSQEQQFFNSKQQTPDQEQFYNNNKQSQEQQFFNNNKQSQEQQFFNNDKQSQGQQYFNNDKQFQEQQFFNGKQQTPDQEQFYNNKQSQEQQFFNNNQQKANQEQFYGDKQQSQEQQQFFNDMHVVGVENQRFNNKPFQGISNQQSTQIRTGPHSTQIKTQGVVQLSAFDNREHPIVLPRGSVQSPTVLVSGLKNLPLLPAMVYNAGHVPSPHAVAFSSDPLYKGAAVRQHFQTPYVRYVYSHIL